MNDTYDRYFFTIVSIYVLAMEINWKPASCDNNIIPAVAGETLRITVHLGRK